MTDPNYAHIAVVLDRSSSMTAIRDATIAAFNDMLIEQKKQPGRADLTLVAFSDNVSWLRTGEPLQDSLPLTKETYIPGGNTALFDAIGKTIDVLGLQISGLNEVHRPGRVLVVVLTDGEENASKQYDNERVRRMIERQRSAYSWEFLFIGAEANTVLVARDIAVPQSNVIRYAATASGVKNSMSAMNNVVTSYRSGGSAAVPVDQQDVQ